MRKDEEMVALRRPPYPKISAWLESLGIDPGTVADNGAMSVSEHTLVWDDLRVDPDQGVVLTRRERELTKAERKAWPGWGELWREEG